MKKIASISLIISGILMLCSGSTFAQEILTLEKALEIAYQQSPSIIQSKMSLEQSELALIQQKASLKSQFSLNLSPFHNMLLLFLIVIVRVHPFYRIGKDDLV